MRPLPPVAVRRVTAALTPRLPPCPRPPRGMGPAHRRHTGAGPLLRAVSVVRTCPSLSHAAGRVGPFVCPGQVAAGCWQSAPTAQPLCAGGTPGWGCCRTALRGASVGPAGRLSCCLPYLECRGPGRAVGGGAPSCPASPLSTSPQCSSSPLCLPVDTQGALHRYCAAVNEGEVRFDSQGQKASDGPPHRLPDNETDCGWAPFGEFPECAVPMRPPRRAALQALRRVMSARSPLAVTVPRR